jgi:hypothetical protein
MVVLAAVLLGECQAGCGGDVGLLDRSGDPSLSAQDGETGEAAT